ncbi:hypothetical protein M5K25_005502 [Dendrobium thyrsiflorum]|uniref:Uncharacterized protein n=1 Tax=Dendrobium thyrsiflorum TaxID=117978 RepID=A0ABD0VJ51_DENTH
MSIGLSSNSQLDSLTHKPIKELSLPSDPAASPSLRRRPTGLAGAGGRTLPFKNNLPAPSAATSLPQRKSPSAAPSRLSARRNSSSDVGPTSPRHNRQHPLRLDLGFRPLTPSPPPTAAARRPDAGRLGRAWISGEVRPIRVPRVVLRSWKKDPVDCAGRDYEKGRVLNLTMVSRSEEEVEEFVGEEGKRSVSRSMSVEEEGGRRCERTGAGL